MSLRNTVISVGPLSEKVNVVSNDHGPTQKCDFTNFTDRNMLDTINDFRDLVVACKMHDWYAKISSISIKRQAIAMAGRYENKPLQNVFNTTYTFI